MDAFSSEDFDLKEWLNQTLQISPVLVGSEQHHEETEGSLSSASVRLQLICNEYGDLLAQHIGALNGAWPRLRRDARVVSTEVTSLKTQLHEVQSLHETALGESAFFKQLGQLDSANERLLSVRNMLARATAWDRMIREGEILVEMAPWSTQDDSSVTVETTDGVDGAQSLASSLSRLSDHCIALERCASDLSAFPGAEERAACVSEAWRTLRTSIDPVLLRSLQRGDMAGTREVLSALERAMGRRDAVVEALARARVLPLLVAWSGYATASVTDADVVEASKAAAVAAGAAAMDLLHAARQQSRAGSSRFVTWQCQYYAAVALVLTADTDSVRGWCGRDGGDGTEDAAAAATVLARMLSIAVGCRVDEGSVSESDHGVTSPGLAQWRLRLDCEGEAGYMDIAQLVDATQRLYNSAFDILSACSSAAVAHSLLSPLAQSLARPFTGYALQQALLETEVFTQATDSAVQACGLRLLSLPVPGAFEQRSSSALSILHTPGHAAPFRVSSRKAAGAGSAAEEMAVALAGVTAAGSAVHSACDAMLAGITRCHRLCASACLHALLGSVCEGLGDTYGRAYAVVLAMHEACTATAAGSEIAPIRSVGAPRVPPRAGASWLDDEKHAVNIGASQSAATVVDIRPSAADIHAACVAAWGLCADGLLLVDVVIAAASAQLAADAPLLAQIACRQGCLERSQSVVQAVVEQILGLDSHAGTLSPKAASAPALTRLNALKLVLEEVNVETGCAEIVESWMDDARNVARALTMQTFTLTFQAALAPIADCLCGLHRSYDVQSGAVPIAATEDSEVQDTLDSYSVQPSQQIVSMCERLLDVARAAAPGNHPLVLGAQAAELRGVQTGVSVRRPDTLTLQGVPLRLVLASHARMALMAIPDQNVADSLTGRPSFLLGAEECDAAERLLAIVGSGTPTQAAHKERDAVGLQAQDSGDAGRAVLVRVAEPLTEGSDLNAWTCRSLELHCGTGTTEASVGSTPEGQIAPGPALASEVAAAMARLWLHALARAACALIATEILRVHTHGGPGPGPRFPLSRSAARQMRADVSYVTTVVRALGCEPRSVLYRAVNAVLGSHGGYMPE